MVIFDLDEILLNPLFFTSTVIQIFVRYPRRKAKSNEVTRLRKFSYAEESAGFYILFPEMMKRGFHHFYYYTF